MPSTLLRRTAAVLLALASIAAGPAPAAATEPWTYRLNSLEHQLFADAADGQLDNLSLFEAALVASGVDDPAQLWRYDQRFDGWVNELRRSIQGKSSPRAKAEVVFNFLHRRILTGGYRLERTNLRHSLDQGQYNCVSATVLFHCLAEAVGLEVCGLELPGHAMSRVRWPGGSLDVETTCPRWFQFVDEPKKRAELVQGGGPVFVAIADVNHPKAPAAAKIGTVPAKRQKAREIGPLALVAMIYYNTGVDCLGERRFDEAAAANAKAMRLDPTNPIARGNYLATLNNWAIELGTAGHYAEAADLLRLGLAIAPSYGAFGQNHVHLCRQWFEKLCAAGRFDEARRLLDSAAADQPGEPFFTEAKAELARRSRERGAGSGR